MRPSPSGMRRRLGRTSLLVVVASGLLGTTVACSDSEAQPPTPTITAPATSTTEAPPETESTTESPGSTSEAAPPTTTGGDAEVPEPDAVDAAYVEGVLRVLLETYRAFLAQVKAEGQVTPAARAALGLAFAPAAATELADGADPARIGDPQPAPMRDLEVMDSGEGCILASVDLDVSTWFAPPPDLVQPFFVRLEASAHSGTAAPWLVFYIRSNELGEAPAEGWECT